jgi:hypothetical protein
MASENTTEQPAAKVRRAKVVREDGSLEKFTIERVHRSKLKGADYNPRQISDDARRKLKENLERVGLLSPLVWNATTGNIVSGHQRLTQMDQLMGTPDYHLNVAKVELDERSEREQNVFFNNQQAMGDWDFEKLGELFQTGMTVAHTGFDAGDIKDLFGGDVLEATELQELSDAVTKAHEMAKDMSADADTGQENNFYSVLVFEDDAKAAAFNRWLGIKDDRYIDSRRVLAAIAEKIAEGDLPPEFLLK